MDHTKKMAISIIPLLLMAILLSFEVQAYTLTKDFSNGIYWKVLPIQMNQFITDPKDGALLEQLTNEAVEEWENAAGKNLWNFSPIKETSSYVGNYIRWSNDFGNETGYDPTKTLAITIRYNKGTYFEQTVIILNGNLNYLKQNSGNCLKTTILHEMGHTLGLDHSNANSIMSPNLSSLASLQTDDREGVVAVVDEMLKRQESGFISPLAEAPTKKKNLLSSCGTVDDIGNGKGPISGVGNFILSGILGLLGVALVGNKNKSLKYSVGKI